MDWKAWYRAEAESAAGRAAIAAAVARHPDGDADVRHVLSQGGIVSFPHTTLRDSAEPLARVATSILAEPFERVVALGVLHGSSLPEPERSRFAAAGDGDEAAMAQVGGGLSCEGNAETPLGPVPAGPLPSNAPWLRPGGSLLAKEFSLDLFLAVLAGAAAMLHAGAPAVTRVFVGPTGGEGSGPSVAEALAAALRPLLGPRVALVCTGDLVHAGHGYSTPEEVAALPAGGERLREHFAGRVQEMLDAALTLGAASRAATVARELRNDQRHLLPVIAALLGRGASARILSFGLTDYGAILGRPSPCVVASALVAMERDTRDAADPGGPMR